MVHRHENENQAEETRPADANPQAHQSIELVHDLIDNARDIVAECVGTRENLG